MCLELSRSGTLRLDLRLLLPDPRSSSEAVLVSQQVHTHVHMYPMSKKSEELCRHQLALSNNSHETSFSEEVCFIFTYSCLLLLGFEPFSEGKCLRRRRWCCASCQAMGKQMTGTHPSLECGFKGAVQMDTQ